MNPKVILIAISFVTCGVINETPFINLLRRRKSQAYCQRKIAADDRWRHRFAKTRNDKQALAILEKVLRAAPDELDALWGKAEVLRRRRDYRESELILNKILRRKPYHASSLLSLSYIRLKENNFKEALRLVNRALAASRKDNDKENQALAYVMLGTINGQRCSNTGIFLKVRYGWVSRLFLKAERLAPDLPEVHLALGTFIFLRRRSWGQARIKPSGN